MSTLWQSIAGLPNFLLYFALALVLLTIFVAIYVRVTSYREFVLIRGGNVAAAISLSGALIGFVLPLASAIAHSVNPVDMVAWAPSRCSSSSSCTLRSAGWCRISARPSKPTGQHLQRCSRHSRSRSASSMRHA